MQFTLQTFTIYTKIGACTMQRFVNECVCVWSRCSIEPFDEPIHHNKTIHNAYKVRREEERCQNVRVPQLSIYVRWSLFRCLVHHVIRFTFESKVPPLHARNRHNHTELRDILHIYTIQTTAQHTQTNTSTFAGTRRTKYRRNLPNNNFNNIVCLILGLFRV